MNVNISNISSKFISIFYRLLRVFQLFPKRLYRFFYHFYRGITFQVSRKEYWKDEASASSRASVILLWLAEFTVLFLECFGIGECYETLMDFGKLNTRKLYSWEIEMAKSIYGDSIDYQQVRIDEKAWLGPKQFHFCYVSFSLINSWNTMQKHVLIHELMHIWQYQQMGAIYMLRALIAQHTKMGYNYGGLPAIEQKMAQGETLLDFNLEQQADVIADYYLLKNGYYPQWALADQSHLNIFQNFVEQTLFPSTSP
jgi:hypothetical protein